MKSVLNTLGLLLITVSVACAQDFKKETDKYRKKYKEEFLSSANSPLKEADLPFLQFYEADSAYRVVAKFEKSRGQSFEMPTYSGVNKTYVKYGKVKFRINGRKQTLTVYRSLSLQQLAKYKDYLFIPFKDKTNGDESYGGGRYLDLKTTDIKDGELVLDFNKAYNPYCAYNHKYSCPIVPSENHLDAEIRAGVKKFHD